MKTLIVIDMQNDFIDGALGTKEAVEIVPRVKQKIAEYVNRGDEIIFTRDTHSLDKNYLNTHEGKNLPVPHCIKGTEGWKIPNGIDIPECDHIDKHSFGWPVWDVTYNSNGNLINRDYDEIEIIGLCTDICVVSNALILRALFPEIEITVDASCCAGTTPDMHEKTLDVMRSCQIKITN
jgi:nicotinamidase-related amidase